MSGLFSYYLGIFWIWSSCFSDAGDLESLAIYYAQSSKGDPAPSCLSMWCLILIKRKLANTMAVTPACRVISTVRCLLFTFRVSALTQVCIYEDSVPVEHKQSEQPYFQWLAFKCEKRPAYLTKMLKSGDGTWLSTKNHTYIEEYLATLFISSSL